LLPLAFFRVESAPVVFFRAAVVRGAPSVRDFEDVVFFAKLPSFVASRRDIRALYDTALHVSEQADSTNPERRMKFGRRHEVGGIQPPQT
jgi:hypothetical protein